MLPLWSALFVGFGFLFFLLGFHQDVHLSISLCWVLCFIDVSQAFIIILEANKKILLLKKKQPPG
jgi:hypothetical protein